MFIVLQRIPYSYFAVFDGHGGTGSALMASQTLHSHIEEKLKAIKDLLTYNDHNIYTSSLLTDAMATTINTETLVRGVLEQAFLEMVSASSIYLTEKWQHVHFYTIPFVQNSIRSAAVISALRELVYKTCHLRRFLG